ALFELLLARQRGEAVDAGALTAAIEAATRHAVAQQIAAGIDVGNDGEQGRESFVTYVRDRLSGFGGEHRRPVMRDITHFRSFLELRAPQFARDQVSLLRTPQAIADVRHVDGGPLARELDTLTRVLGEQPRGFAETYVMAVADAMASEYEAVAAHGVLLQIDCPDLAMERHTAFADRPLDEFLDWVDLNIRALRHALRNVPADRVRM